MKKVLPILLFISCIALIIEVSILLKRENNTYEEEQQGSEYNMGDIEETTLAEEESTANKNSSQKAVEILREMTLHEKVCQMLFVKPEGLTGVQQVVAAGEVTREALKNFPVGGIIYSKPNMKDKEQLRQMIDNTNEYSHIGLFIAADEEGGVVNRLMDTVGTTYINSMYTYKNQGTQVAYNNAKTIADDMSALGFNLDFAPVADVWSNKENRVIGERAYSDDYDEAAELISHSVQGFHDGNILCTLKHFPGHGDTSEDSHYSSAYVNKTKEELQAGEFLPFESGIEAGADFVMVGHLIVPDIDEQPATLSQKVIQDILKGELGFKGIIITDSLSMNALTDNYSCGEMAVKAVQAGNDMLLEPENIKEAADALENAVNRGEISEERIDESVRKILSLKIEKGLKY